MKRYTVIDTDCEADVWFDSVENKTLDYKDIEKILEKQDVKWQKLKEFISNRSVCAGYVVQVRLIWDILEKMQELEGEDEI